MSNDSSAQEGGRCYTVFCVGRDEPEGSTWIGEADAATAQEAARLGRAECAEAWGYEEDAILVRGVAEGSVNILEWDDHDCVIKEESLFTVFLAAAGDSGEQAVGTAYGATPEDAARRYRDKIMALPEYADRALRVIGIARGDVDSGGVSIVDWNEEACLLEG